MLRPFSPTPPPRTPCQVSSDFSLPLTLRHKDGGGNEEAVVVELCQGKTSCTIGRGSKCDVKLGLVSISKQHAEITASARGHQLFIRNLSRNAETSVNGVDLIGTEEKMALQDGDEIKIGRRIERTLVLSCPNLAPLQQPLFQATPLGKGNATSGKTVETPKEVGRTPLKSINRARTGKLTIVEKPRIPESPAEEQQQQQKAIKPRAPAPSSTSNPSFTLDCAPSEEAPMSRQPIHGAAKNKATKPRLSIGPSAASASVECSPSVSTSSTASPALSEGSLSHWDASNHGSSRSGSAAPAPGAVSALREGSPFFLYCRERSPVMRADNPHASITEQAALLSEQWKAMPEAAKERYRLMASGQSSVSHEPQSLWDEPGQQRRNSATTADLLPRKGGKSPGEKRQITPKTSPEKGIGQEGSGSSAAPQAAVHVPLAADVAHVAKHAAKHVPTGGHAAEPATPTGGGSESVHVAGRGKREGIAVRDAAFFAVGAAAAAAIVIAIRRG